MLIRWVTLEDIPKWLELSQQYDKYVLEAGYDLDAWYDYGNFNDYMIRKIENFNAIIAEDRMTKKCLGVLAFSKTHNRVTFFAVSHDTDFNEVAQKLYIVAFRQLDSSKDISVKMLKCNNGIYASIKKFYIDNGFTLESETVENNIDLIKFRRPATYEKHGKSFHYDYDNYHKYAQKEFCKPCNNAPMADDLTDIAELEYSYATAERIAQGKLFGKCHMMIKIHAEHFEDVPTEHMIGFMKEVQIVGKALHKVTGAIKINYEMHANSGPHLHIHLFPRYLDDDFPSAPIDYRVTEPSPYKDDEEFGWFVNEMRKEIELLSGDVE